jgi:hypothetical protein
VLRQGPDGRKLRGLARRTRDAEVVETGRRGQRVWGLFAEDRVEWCTVMVSGKVEREVVLEDLVAR